MAGSIEELAHIHGFSLDEISESELEGNAIKLPEFSLRTKPLLLSVFNPSIKAKTGLFLKAELLDKDTSAKKT